MRTAEHSTGQLPQCVRGLPAVWALQYSTDVTTHDATDALFPRFTRHGLREGCDPASCMDRLTSLTCFRSQSSYTCTCLFTFVRWDRCTLWVKPCAVCDFAYASRPEGMAFFFFFQAEDGIRDLTVTGVQTCALPI